MERFRNVPGHPFEGGFKIRLVPEKLEQPLRWSKPKMIFTCSMSDIFHEDVPADYIAKIFKVIQEADWHIFQVLTKRAERLAQLSDSLPWPGNIWLGVSIENAESVHRVEALKVTPAHTKFLSIEPLIGKIESLPLIGIDWVIVGGESGINARPMDPEWARLIRDQCLANNVPFFLKQLGGRNGKRGGEEALLDGKIWREFPEVQNQIAA
jgi:protein gp37